MAATVLSGGPAAHEGVLASGACLGDFEIVRKLGQGGMGEVYLARQISLDRAVALKFLSTALAQRPDLVERFHREARTLARLDHPNIIRAYAVDQAQGRHFVAMEYVDGRTMREWLKDLGRIPVGDAVRITISCAEALCAAHEMRTVHRDIKPDNVMVTRKGVVKVSDFGLAKALDEDLTITESGAGVGTPYYMAPEQARNAKYADHRSDIYALGCTLYHFVTGEPPFRDESTMELLLKKERGHFTPARSLNPEVPERLDLILDKMMAKNPAHRFRDYGELLESLRSLGLEGGPPGFVAENGAGSRGGRRSPRDASGTPNAQAATRTSIAARPPAEELWFVQISGTGGKRTVARLSTEQVRRGLKAGTLPPESRAKRSGSRDSFPLAQFPEFERLVQSRVITSRAKSHAAQMEDLYAQIARQARWRPLKLRLRRFVEAALGFGSLMLWLALIAAVLWGLYLAYPIAMGWLAQRINLD